MLYPPVVSQNYLLESHSKSVIYGNSAILKCEIPSFVADFVYVTGWIEETSGHNYIPTNDYGTNSPTGGYYIWKWTDVNTWTSDV